MSISARHRSPLLHESPDLPKDFYSFQSAAQPGGALFCSSLFEVIYQLYPTANVFCAIDISVYKTAISSLFFTCCIQQRTVNFAKSYKTIAILGVLPHFLGLFLCNLSNYAGCTVFRLKFIHFGNAVKSPQITRAIFVRFLSVSLQFTSFFFPSLLLSYLYTTSLVQKGPLDVF